MKKQKVRRLTLNRDTIRQLDNPQLDELAGGLSTQCSFVCCPALTDDTCPTQ